MAAILSGIGLARQKMGEEAQKNYKKGKFFCYFGKLLSGSCDYHTHGNPIIYLGYFLLSLLLTLKKSVILF